MNNVRPHLKMLNEEQVQDIHQYTLKILSTTGVRVDSPSALEMLKKRVGDSMVTDRTVRIPAELVEWAIKAAPRQIQMYDRRGNPQFTIGGEGDRTGFGIGVTALYYQEPDTDTPVLFQRRHMQDMVRVGNKLPHYDMVSTVGIVRDVPEHLTDLYGSLEHFANGIKPMVLLCSDEHKFDDVMQMFETLHGRELGDKPFIIPYFNPVSPLVMNEGTVHKMRIAIERGLPVIISNYSMSGATTPIIPAGEVLDTCNSGDVVPLSLPPELIQAYKDAAHDPTMLLQIAPIYHLDVITAPVQIHIGTNDGDTVGSTPPEWAYKLNQALIDAGKNVELFRYEGERHSFIGDAWLIFMKRAVAFFDKHVMNPQ